MTTADNELLKELFHPTVFKIIEDAEDVEDAVCTYEVCYTV